MAFTPLYYTTVENGVWHDLPVEFKAVPDWQWAKWLRQRHRDRVLLETRDPFTNFNVTASIEVHALAFTPPQAGYFIRWDCISGFGPQTCILDSFPDEV